MPSDDTTLDAVPVTGLLGRVLLLDTPTGDAYTVSRFAERLTDTLYLMQILNPNTGRPFAKDGQYVLDVLDLVMNARRDDPGWPHARIFADWPKCQRFAEQMNGKRTESVVQLVKPPSA